MSSLWSVLFAPSFALHIHQQGKHVHVNKINLHHPFHHTLRLVQDSVHSNKTGLVTLLNPLEIQDLKWIFISYGIYESSCVFYIPEPLARGYKTLKFHKYHMKWKFVSDSLYHIFPKNINISWKKDVFWENSARKSPWSVVLYATS